MNHPLATLFGQSFSEGRYMKNVTDRTLAWHRVEFTNYQRTSAEAPLRHGRLVVTV